MILRHRLVSPPYPGAGQAEQALHAPARRGQALGRAVGRGSCGEDVIHDQQGTAAGFCGPGGAQAVEGAGLVGDAEPAAEVMLTQHGPGALQ